MNARVAAATPALADAVGLPLADAQTELLLEQKAGRLQLRDLRPLAPGPIWVDLAALRGGGRRQLLGRAVGIRSGVRPLVIDATAGLARDAAELASLGCQVTAIERSPVVAAMLRDGLARAPELAERLQLIEGDAIDCLAGLAADVILLDPMFPPGKRALAKKPSQYLQALLGQPEDVVALFEAARRSAARRVVVKRPLHGPPLVGTPAASHRFKGKSVRFDVYLGGSG